MRRLLVVALTFAALAQTACSEERTLMEPITITSRAPHDVERTVWARMSFTVAGDDRLEVRDRKTKLHLVEIYGDTVPSATYFFSVSAGEPMPIDVGHILFTADIAPGAYKGAPGEYSLTGKGVPPLPGYDQAIGSASYIWFLKPKPLPLVKYDRFIEPCTVRIEEDAIAGSVDCPKLGSDVGSKTVSVRWSWELL